MRLQRDSGAGRGQQGFTLVELMVIVAVIGIASALTFTSMARFLQDQRLRQASLELASYLQSARARAQREGGICQLTLSGTSLAPSSVANNRCAATTTSEALAALDLAAVSGANGLAISGSIADPITFTPMGVLASPNLSSSTLLRILYLSANGTTLQRCVFLDLLSIRVGWRNTNSGVCSYANG